MRIAHLNSAQNVSLTHFADADPVTDQNTVANGIWLHMPYNLSGTALRSLLFTDELCIYCIVTLQIVKVKCVLSHRHYDNTAVKQ